MNFDCKGLINIGAPLLSRVASSKRSHRGRGRVKFLFFVLQNLANEHRSGSNKSTFVTIHELLQLIIIGTGYRYSKC